jgi:hypothetical protein
MIENQRHANKAFASVGVQEKCERNGKLINFMAGVRRAGSLKPGRCKAPERYAQYKKTMKNILIISIILLAGLSSCKKQVENGSPEFIGYWTGSPYGNYGYMYLNINKNSRAYMYIRDTENDHEYHNSGTARADDKKLTIGGTKYFKIIEYPHPIDTNVERHSVINYLDNSFSRKLANWKMVLDGLHGTSHSNLGERTFYKADY